MSDVPVRRSVSACVNQRNTIAPAAPRTPTRTASARNWVFGSRQNSRAKRIRLLFPTLRLILLVFSGEEVGVSASLPAEVAASSSDEAARAKPSLAGRAPREDVVDERCG